MNAERLRSVQPRRVRGCRTERTQSCHAKGKQLARKGEAAGPERQGIAGWGTELAAGLGARGRDRLWELAGPDIPQARCAIPASIFRRYRRCSVRADTADTAAVDSAAGPPPGSLASAPPSRSPPPVLPVRPPPAPFPPLPFPPAVR
eukprot:gene13410-biopygen2692